VLLLQYMKFSIKSKWTT